MPRRATKLAKKNAAKMNCMFTSGEKEMEILLSLNEEGYKMVTYQDVTNNVKASMPDPSLYERMIKGQRWKLCLAIFEKKEVGMTNRYVIAGTALYGEKKEMEEYIKNTKKLDGMYKLLAHMGLNIYIASLAGYTVPYEPEKAAVAKFEIEEEA